MCFHVYHHQMKCDVRPIVKNGNHGLIVNPYTEPKECPCDRNARLVPGKPCELHGCCRLTERRFPCPDAKQCEQKIGQITAHHIYTQLPKDEVRTHVLPYIDEHNNMVTERPIHIHDDLPWVVYPVADAGRFLQADGQLMVSQEFPKDHAIFKQHLARFLRELVALTNAAQMIAAGQSTSLPYHLRRVDIARHRLYHSVRVLGSRPIIGFTCEVAPDAQIPFNELYHEQLNVQGTGIPDPVPTNMFPHAVPEGA